jgi:hypothetical protein
MRSIADLMEGPRVPLPSFFNCLFRILSSKFPTHTVYGQSGIRHEHTFFFCHLIPVPLHNFDRAAGYRGRFE